VDGERLDADWQERATERIISAGVPLNALGHINRDNRIESHFERIAIVNSGGAVLA
jgi:hypothetical protein